VYATPAGQMAILLGSLELIVCDDQSSSPRRPQRGIRRAPTGKAKAWEPERPSTLDTAYSLGILCGGQGKFKEAKEVY
jgi:hypothetical protein